MAYQFTDAPTCTITAKVKGTTDSITMAGINRDVDDPEKATTQMNKILAIVGKELVTPGMVKSVKQGVVENE